MGTQDYSEGDVQGTSEEEINDFLSKSPHPLMTDTQRVGEPNSISAEKDKS